MQHQPGNPTAGPEVGQHVAGTCPSGSFDGGNETQGMVDLVGHRHAAQEAQIG